VLVFVFLECAFIIGLFLPGDSLLIAAGVLLAAHGHESGAWVLGGVATAVAVAGNQVGYLVGRYTGTRMLARKEGRVLNRANLAGRRPSSSAGASGRSSSRGGSPGSARSRR
jgi:membrane-associated protein